MYAKLYEITGAYGSTSVPDGAAEATSTAVLAQSLTTSLQKISFTFATPFSLVSGHHYAISVEYSGGDVSNYVNVQYDAQGTHSGNQAVYSGSWSAAANFDTLFSVGGAPNYTYSLSGVTFGAMITIGSTVLASYVDSLATYGTTAVGVMETAKRNAKGYVRLNISGDQERSKTFNNFALTYRRNTTNTSADLSLKDYYLNYNYSTSPTNFIAGKEETTVNKISFQSKIRANAIQPKIYFIGNIDNDLSPILTSFFCDWNEEEKL